MKIFVSASIYKRAVTAVILIAIFFSCFFIFELSDKIHYDWFGWIVGVTIVILIPLFFWLLYLWIFEVALLIRDRKELTGSHFIPAVILTLFWFVATVAIMIGISNARSVMAPDL